MGPSPLGWGGGPFSAKGEEMADVSVEKRFRGSVRLVTLHLWRIAKSTDVEEGFRAARGLKMFNEENESFVRSCFELDKQLEAGSEPAQPITIDMVDELQACAIRLNSADPA